MCVVYLMNSNSKACLRGGRLVVEREGERVASVPFNELDCLVVSEHAQVTTETVFRLLGQEGQLVYVDFQGRVTGVLEKGRRSLRRLQRQMQTFAAQGRRTELIRQIVQAKLSSQQEFLRRHGSKHRESANEIIQCLDNMLGQLSQMDIDAMRGCEGAAAKRYFDFFPRVLPENWEWQGRNRRPAQDPVNALLNYGYAFLEREVRLAILGVGMDSRVGFFHANDGRRDSLVYDMMEPFRSSIIDNFVIKQINYRRFQPEQFSLEGELGCRLSAEAKYRWAEDYEAYMVKQRSSLQGKSPREWVRSRITAFAKEILHDSCDDAQAG